MRIGSPILHGIDKDAGLAQGANDVSTVLFQVNVRGADECFVQRRHDV